MKEENIKGQLKIACFKSLFSIAIEKILELLF